MTCATLSLLLLSFATLFVFGVQAGIVILAQDYATQKEIERRQTTTGCAGLVALGGNGAVYTTSSGVLYTLYCGILPLPVFYNARSGDASIVNCLSSCDIDPECGASTSSTRFVTTARRPPAMSLQTTQKRFWHSEQRLQFLIQTSRRLRPRTLQPRPRVAWKCRQSTLSPRKSDALKLILLY